MEPTMIDRWPVPTNHRFQCCVCNAQDAYQADDYLLITLTAPNTGQGPQWLGAHSSCLSSAIGDGTIQIP
jgi:hypothetical protein